MSDTPNEQAMDPEERLAALREQLTATPASTIVANHCYGLFELAGAYLSTAPPNFEQARVAIDALEGIVGALPGRLGEDEANLVDALSKMKQAFVTLQGASTES